MDFKLKSESVAFEDTEGNVAGTVIVRQATFLDDQRLEELQREYEELTDAELKSYGEDTVPPEQYKFIIFRLNFYPKLAACSEGDVPTPEQAFWEMPTEQFAKWWEIVRKVNPRWFEVFKPFEDMTEEELKKKLAKLAESFRGSESSPEANPQT